MKLLKFSATWCNPCQMQKREFEINSLKDVELVEIDIDDDDNGLTSQYKVMSIPTLILIDDNENVLSRWTGYTKTEVINKFIEDLKNN